MRGFIGIDIETTGLTPDQEEILEIGAILFDDELNEVESLNVVAPTNAGYIRACELDLDDYVLSMHRKSGLLDEIATKPGADVARLGALVGYIQSWTAMLGGKVPMLGSSVHFDRAFLKVHVPGVHDLFSYRNIDASSLMEIGKVMDPEGTERRLAGRPEQAAHRALDDIRASADLIKRLWR